MANLPGSIRQRGPNSWQIRYESGPPDEFGRRQQSVFTIRGRRSDAEKALIAAVAAKQAGITPATPASHDLPVTSASRPPCQWTVASYMDDWLDDNHDFAPKTLERYEQINERQISRFLGAIPLDQLRPARAVKGEEPLGIEEWLAELHAHGAANGRALKPRTVLHAYRLLHTGYERAVALGYCPRNPLRAVKAPRVPSEEIEILSAAEIAILLPRLRHSPDPTKQRVYPIATVALGSGARRGEILAMRWPDLDFAKGTWRIARSLEETDAGLRCKDTKTRRGRRTITLGKEVLACLAKRREEILAHRVMFGLGRLRSNDLVFCGPLGEPLSPDTLSRDWGNVIRDIRELTPVSFHALRHTHVSLLIAGGADIVKISARIGHSSVATTLRYYGHLFDNRDNDLAGIADRIMQPPALPGPASEGIL